jgi:hypothetical protein
MTRKVAVLLAIALATFAFADLRTVERSEKVPNGATAGGVVESVNGNLIQLAGGLVTIDATGARINVRGKDAGIASIEPGMLLFAALTNAGVHANAPLPAATITATTLPEATLFGPVQSVDTAAKTLTVLGRTIHVTDETSFGGIYKKRDTEAPSLDDILPNHIVQIVAEERGGKLVATSILLLAPAPPEVHATRGEVRSIGTDSWVIERDRGDDITVVIDAQTKIVGSPKVGDTVELLYRVDSSNANVAISIVKFDRPTPPPIPDVFRFAGQVKLITDASWLIDRGEGGEQKVLIDGNSKIEPGIKVGDAVEVLAQRHDDGTLTALAIVKRRF